MNQASLEASRFGEVLLNAPLVDLTAADERSLLVAWDATGTVYQFDRDLRLLKRLEFGDAFRSAALSLDGSCLAIATADGVCRWIDPAQGPIAQVRIPDEPAVVAVDPLGWHIAVVGANGGELFVYDRSGARVSRAKTLRSIRYLTFAAGQPVIVAASGDASLLACQLDGTTLWRHNAATRIGGLAMDFAAKRVILPAFTAGLLRFDSEGKPRANVSAPPLPARLAISPAGDLLLIGTLEDKVVLQQADGRVLWSCACESPIAQVVLDPLGRLGWVGLQTGRIFQVDLTQSPTAIPAPAQPKMAAPVVEVAAKSVESAPLVEPRWKMSLGIPAEEAPQTLLAVLKNPLRIGVLGSNRSLRVYSPDVPPTKKKPLHHSGVLEGVGRTLLAGSGRFIALTESRVMIYDAFTNQAHVTDARLYEVTHAELCGDHELLIVQERQRVSRMWFDGRTAWEVVLSQPLDHWASGSDRIALACDDGSLVWLDRSGEITAHEPPEHEDRRLVAAYDDGFICVFPAKRIARRYSTNGDVVSEISVPVTAWSVTGLGAWGLFKTAAGDGWLLGSDDRWRQLGAATTQECFYSRGTRFPGRVYEQTNCLSCGDAAGRVFWRSMHDLPLASMTASEIGVAAVLGQQLCWFDPPQK